MTNGRFGRIIKMFGCRNSSAVAPDESAIIRTCSLCVEPGATKRKCCNALYCDHCYTKNQKCPNCETLTKREALTGATFQMKVFSEHEECRICLDPGLKRRCCGNYYCDECYYQVPTCRSCNLPVSNPNADKNNIFMIDQAELVSVLLGWMITVFFLVVTVAFFAVVITAEVETPVGLFDYKCYGFFRKCEFHVCIDMDKSVANGTAAIPALSDWQKCTLDSVAKLESRACIYDRQLYEISDKLMGYDVCQEEYNNGLYIFEDTFEYWGNTSFQSNAMKSATWDSVTNGYASQYCGPGKHFGGKYSMSFQGPFQRFAATNDLDMQTGGRVEAELFLPPIGFDAFNAHCKTGYIGAVDIDYSTSQGVNWTNLARYDPAIWRSKDYIQISIEIPEEARTNATRFRFNQPVFASAIDHWALDNVRVLRYNPPKWRELSSFQKNYRRAMDYIQRAQCCGDTDWCNHRLTDYETSQCEVEFPLWYSGREYLIRLTEMLLCGVVVLNILKSLYIIAADYAINKRIPLHDEILELFEYDLVSAFYNKYVPLRYRYTPWITQNEFVLNIHKSARMEEELRGQYKDEEGEGELKKRQEVLEQERKAELKKIRKQKRKLEKRMKNKNFKSSTVVVGTPSSEPKFDDVTDYESKEEDNTDDIDGINNVDIATEQDKLRRQNVAMLRIPFTMEVNETFRSTFTYISLGVFAILFVFLLGYVKNYVIYEPIFAFNEYYTRLSLTSVLVIFFAAFCDFKEIYYTLRQIVPARDRWVPELTVDLSDEVRCLFVGNSMIPLNEIKEIQAFPESFMHYCLVGYGLGVFPWCLFSLLMREAYLEYTSMRVVTPLLGSIAIIRAVLGPSFVVKCFFSFKYLLDYNYRVRENMGIAFQQENTFNTSVNTALMLTVVGVFLCAAVAYNFLPIVVGVCIAFGLIYGAFTGCIHNLPIKPWIYMTALRGGVWMTVKKRQACPCVYWGKYCTPMHAAEELLVIYTTDDLKFVSLINGGIAALHSTTV